MRALICTHHLNYWSGSELVALEIAEALRDRGVGVDLYCPWPDEKFVSTWLTDLGGRLLTTPAEVSLHGYDLVYVQHQTVSRLMTGANAEAAFAPSRPLFVYNHLSTQEPFELPGPFLEVDIADVIWTQSPRTLEVYRARFHPRFAEAECVPNPAPAGFALSAPPGRPRKLRRLLSVSNHLPEELAAAFDILRAAGVEVTRFGNPDGNRRLTAADVFGHDAVVTIGKSVQYALRSRKPVFCYDHFGGPGWLDADSFPETARRNFSGLNAPDRRSAEDLAGLLRDGFARAAGFAARMDDALLAPYRLEDHIDRLVSRVAAHRAASAPLVVERDGPCDRPAVMARWAHEADIYGLIDREYGRRRETMQVMAQKNAALRNQLRALKKKDAERR